MVLGFGFSSRYSRALAALGVLGPKLAGGMEVGIFGNCQLAGSYMYHPSVTSYSPA